jgi:hypothetical protein
MMEEQDRRKIDELERAFTRQAIDELEQGLSRDDAEFVRRFRHRYRVEIATAISVFLLLATGAVLLTVGFATVSWPIWIGGALAFVGSFGVNALHDRTLQQGR